MTATTEQQLADLEHQEAKLWNAHPGMARASNRASNEVKNKARMDWRNVMAMHRLIVALYWSVPVMMLIVVFMILFL